MSALRPLDLMLTGARVLGPEGLSEASLAICGGLVSDGAGGRPVDLSGYLVLPGIVDVHGDGFERHVAPRRGAVSDITLGLAGVEAELAANGITTGVLAQFFSWEGGLRGPDFAEKMADGLAAIQGRHATDMRLQLRLETNLIDDYPWAEALIDRAGISYVVFNDHLPHAALAAGKRPPRLTGTALKSGRSPEAHLALMQDLHARSHLVPGRLAPLIERLRARGVRLGSHDDPDAAARVAWAAQGVAISEFPETLEAAQAAQDGGAPAILGAPNVLRGASHKGLVSARAVIAAGLGDALASDYFYPAPRAAAWMLADEIGLAAAWALVSSGPARVLGLADRGTLAPGKRADIVILDAATGAVGATIAGGVVSYATGAVAGRLIAP